MGTCEFSAEWDISCGIVLYNSIILQPYREQLVVYRSGFYCMCSLSYELGNVTVFKFEYRSTESTVSLFTDLPVSLNLCEKKKTYVILILRLCTIVGIREF